MTAVFVYGTLMAEQVLARVVFGEKELKGLHYSDATLKGYRRYKLQERDYPGVMASAGSSVEGKLVSGVDANALARLDFFEGDEYDREKVQVVVAGGTVEAYVYLWKNKAIVLEEEWQLSDFVEQNLDKWVADVLDSSEGMGGRFWSADKGEPSRG